MNYVSVIVTYNRKKLLLTALDSVLKQNPQPAKVILIDNHSTDGTESMIKESELMNNNLFRYVRLPENVGGSGGFSKGVELALEYDADWREYYWIRNRTVTVKELGRNRLMVNVWLLLFIPVMFTRILRQSMYKHKRLHAMYVHLVGTRDAWIGKMGKNPKFLP